MSHHDDEKIGKLTRQWVRLFEIVRDTPGYLEWFLALVPDMLQNHRKYFAAWLEQEMEKSFKKIASSAAGYNLTHHLYVVVKYPTVEVREASEDELGAAAYRALEDKLAPYQRSEITLQYWGGVRHLSGEYARISEAYMQKALKAGLKHKNYGEIERKAALWKSTFDTAVAVEDFLEKTSAETLGRTEAELADLEREALSAESSMAEQK